MNPRLTSNLTVLLLGLAVALCPLPASSAAEDVSKVILHLKNGDRIAGTVLSEDKDRVVLSTPWNEAIFVPVDQISSREIVPPPDQRPAAQAKPGAGQTNEVAATTPDSDGAVKGQTPEVLLVTEPPKPPPSAAEAKKKSPSPWKWNLRLGADFINGARNRKIFYGRTSLTYARSFRSNARKFVRNKLDYRVDYGETDGDVSANRMHGTDKLDVDIGEKIYAYNFAGLGYDLPRKIELTVEVGPGAGYHLVNTKVFALDAEMGLNFQTQQRLDAPDRDLLQLRLGEELTWQVYPKVTLDQQLAFLPAVRGPEDFQIRAEANLAFGIVQHLSLNLTVLNLYDSQPSAGVPNNEIQFRSSVGVNF